MLLLLNTILNIIPLRTNSKKTAGNGAPTLKIRGTAVLILKLYFYNKGTLCCKGVLFNSFKGLYHSFTI